MNYSPLPALYQQYQKIRSSCAHAKKSLKQTAHHLKVLHDKNASFDDRTVSSYFIGLTLYTGMKRLLQTAVFSTALLSSYSFVNRGLEESHQANEPQALYESYQPDKALAAICEQTRQRNQHYSPDIQQELCERAQQVFVEKQLHDDFASSSFAPPTGASGDIEQGTHAKLKGLLEAYTQKEMPKHLLEGKTTASLGTMALDQAVVLYEGKFGTNVLKRGYEGIYLLEQQQSGRYSERILPPLSLSEVIAFHEGQQTVIYGLNELKGNAVIKIVAPDDYTLPISIGNVTLTLDNAPLSVSVTPQRTVNFHQAPKQERVFTGAEHNDNIYIADANERILRNFTFPGKILDISSADIDGDGLEELVVKWSDNSSYTNIQTRIISSKQDSPLFTTPGDLVSRQDSTDFPNIATGGPTGGESIVYHSQREWLGVKDGQPRPEVLANGVSPDKKPNIINLENLVGGMPCHFAFFTGYGHPVTLFATHDGVPSLQDVPALHGASPENCLYFKDWHTIVAAVPDHDEDKNQNEKRDQLVIYSVPTRKAVTLALPFSGVTAMRYFPQQAGNIILLDKGTQGLSASIPADIVKFPAYLHGTDEKNEQDNDILAQCSADE